MVRRVVTCSRRFDQPFGSFVAGSVRASLKRFPLFEVSGGSRYSKLGAG